MAPSYNANTQGGLKNFKVGKTTAKKSTATTNNTNESGAPTPYQGDLPAAQQSSAVTVAGMEAYVANVSQIQIDKQGQSDSSSGASSGATMSMQTTSQRNLQYDVFYGNYVDSMSNRPGSVLNSENQQSDSSGMQFDGSGVDSSSDGQALVDDQVSSTAQTSTPSSPSDFEIDPSSESQINLNSLERKYQVSAVVKQNSNRDGILQFFNTQFIPAPRPTQTTVSPNTVRPSATSGVSY